MPLKLDFDRNRREQFHNTLFNTPRWNESPLINLHPLQATRAPRTDQLTDTFYNTGIGGFPGGNAYRSGVTLPNGKVFFVPYTATNARLFDPESNTVEVLTGYTFPGGNSHRSGVLLDDGRVFLVPWLATTPVIYDYRNNSFTAITNIAWSGTSRRTWSMKLPGNKIFFLDINASAQHWIYDATLNAYSSASLVPMDTSGYATNLTPLEDGRILMTPRTAGLSSIKIYDVNTHTTSSVSGLTTLTADNWYVTSVLLPNGKVLICPSSGDTFSLFNPLTNSISTVATITAVTNAYRPAIMLPDGRVQLAPWAASTQPTIYYDWITNTISTGVGYDGFAQGNGAVMIDGRVAYPPGNSATLYVWGNSSYGGCKIPSTKFLNSVDNNSSGVSSG